MFNTKIYFKSLALLLGQTSYVLSWNVVEDVWLLMWGKNEEVAALSNTRRCHAT